MANVCCRKKRIFSIYFPVGLARCGGGSLKTFFFKNFS
jgi:hypothetical protein